MDTKLSVYICLLGIMQMRSLDTHFNGLRLPAIFQNGEVDFFFTLFTDLAGQWIVTITVGPGLYFVFFLIWIKWVIFQWERAPRIVRRAMRMGFFQWENGLTGSWMIFLADFIFSLSATSVRSSLTNVSANVRCEDQGGVTFILMTASNPKWNQPGLYFGLHPSLSSRSSCNMCAYYLGASPTTAGSLPPKDCMIQ